MWPTLGKGKGKVRRNWGRKRRGGEIKDGRKEKERQRLKGIYGVPFWEAGDGYPSYDCTSETT